jgi:hypothetical protein
MFFLTSISHYPEHKWQSRCFGYFSTIEKARGAVANNTCDMEECCYNYLVIEEIGEGIHSFASSESWFTWEEENGWTAIEKPKWSEGIINWSIG